MAEAFKIGESFLEGEHSMLILGDNLFYGNFLRSYRPLKSRLANWMRLHSYFAYKVNDERFGVVEFVKIRFYR